MSCLVIAVQVTQFGICDGLDTWTKRRMHGISAVSLHRQTEMRYLHHRDCKVHELPAGGRCLEIKLDS